MRRIRIPAVVGIAAAGLIGGVVAMAQQPPPAPPTTPAPTEITLPRNRLDNAALARARQDPLAERLRGVLRQSPAAAVVGQTQASAVPVLAPGDPSLLATAEFTPGDRFYMLTVQNGEQVIEIYGATKAFQSPAQVTLTAPPPSTRITAAARVAPTGTPPVLAAQGVSNLRLERTEYGIDAAFSRFGAAYNVTFMCGAPNEIGCTDASAVQFISQLQLIGGGA